MVALSAHPARVVAPHAATVERPQGERWLFAPHHRAHCRYDHRHQHRRTARRPAANARPVPVRHASVLNILSVNTLRTHTWQPLTLCPVFRYTGFVYITRTHTLRVMPNSRCRTSEETAQTLTQTHRSECTWCCVVCVNTGWVLLEDDDVDYTSAEYDVCLISEP